MAISDHSARQRLDQHPRPPCHTAHDQGVPMSQPIQFEVVFTASAEVTPAKPAQPEQTDSTTPEKE